MAALIGFDMLHYAKMPDDGDNVNTGKATYDTVNRIMEAISANINPNASDDTLFTDDGPSETATALGKIALELGAADFPADKQADMLGHDYIGGMIVRKGNDVPPWLAVGGRCLKSNGAYRYFWLTKGKMSEPEQKHETKKDKVSFQTPTMKGSFVRRDCDNVWIVEMDSDCEWFTTELANSWFSKVMGPEDLPLAFSSSVMNNAANVPINANILLTFNKAPSATNIIATNITLVKYDDASAVTVTVTLDGTGKIATIAPSSPLAVNTNYKLTVKAATGIASDKTILFKTAMA